MKALFAKYLLFSTVFFFSGMTGMTYESVWSQYLKILTGHAAFAQSFILVLFLAGLAIGAWYGLKIFRKFKNPFISYAVVEFVIGILAISFHPIFDEINYLLFDNLFSGCNKTAVDLIKWSFAIILTLPPVLLMGATFPILVAAMELEFPKRKHQIVSHLYFLNSLGASAGVLLTSFFLIKNFGLPGTLLISGFTNILISTISFAGAFLAIKSPAKTDNVILKPAFQPPVFIPPLRLKDRQLVVLIFLGAFLSGATSFFYEIGWIRMLSMTLGSSVYAFEIMLSAFILGIAIGSLSIKYLIKKIENIINWLAIIQIFMGVMAVFSILSYNALFDLMAWMMELVQRNENGFLLFLTGSHIIAMLMMLPATILAGMALPVMILILQNWDSRKNIVGKTYSIDTLGGIAGVVIAVHFLLPFFGLKYLLVIGGSLDILIGIVFFMLQSKIRLDRWLFPLLAGLFGFLLVAVFLFDINPQKSTSAVFRYGKIGHSKKILFQKDGKTSSIAVFETQKGNIVLSINGKPDASVNIYRQITGDEATQVLLAALPFAFDTTPENVGIIGLGCGKTAHIALTNLNIRRVDVVEIEPVVYQASHYFKDYVKNIFIDSRFQLHIDDARTYFSSTQTKYDLIISEPSNPWISGIGSLFTDRFYNLMTKNLTDDGIFVQWIQTYEMTVPLVASIMKSLSPVFKDYQIYFMDDGDLAIIAKKSGVLQSNFPKLFDNIELRRELSRIGIENSADFEVRLLGNKEILDPFFFSYQVAATNDYYPTLEYEAVKAGFMNFSASNLIELLNFPAQVIPSLLNKSLPNNLELSANAPFQHAAKFKNAEKLSEVFKALNENTNLTHQNLSEESVLLANSIRQIENKSDSLNFLYTWTPYLPMLAKSIIPYLTTEKLEIIWRFIQQSDGFVTLPESIKKQVLFYKAVGNQDFVEIIKMTDSISFDELSPLSYENEYYYTCRIWALLMVGENAEAARLYKTVRLADDRSLVLRLLGNLAEERNRKASVLK